MMNKAIDCTLIYTDPLCYFDADELRQAIFAERLLFDILGNLQPVLMDVIAGGNQRTEPFEILYRPDDVAKLFGENTDETFFSESVYTDNVLEAAKKILDTRIEYELLNEEGKYEQMEFIMGMKVEDEVIRLMINHNSIPYLPYMKLKRKGL